MIGVQTIEKTSSILSAMNAEIVNRMDSKGITNTGRAAKSLRVQSDNNSVQSVGIHYIEELTDGRPPGEFPPFDDIHHWVQTKLGITGSGSRGVAYVIGIKIAEQGTQIYRKEREGLQLDALVKDTADKLRQEIPASIAIQLRSELRSINQKLSK